jgi:hypothetical protein
MKLFAVRVIEDNIAVGLFFLSHVDNLFWAVDEICDPYACEYQTIKPPAAVFFNDGPMPPPPDIDDDPDIWVKQMSESLHNSLFDLHDDKWSPVPAVVYAGKP